MKLTAIGILKWNGPETTPIFLGCATDVSNFGYFQVGAFSEARLRNYGWEQNQMSRAEDRFV
jgi:hypothetical protein